MQCILKGDSEKQAGSHSKFRNQHSIKLKLFPSSVLTHITLPYIQNLVFASPKLCREVIKWKHNAKAMYFHVQNPCLSLMVPRTPDLQVPFRRLSHSSPTHNKARTVTVTELWAELKSTLPPPNCRLLSWAWSCHMPPGLVSEETEVVPGGNRALPQTSPESRPWKSPLTISTILLPTQAPKVNYKAFYYFRSKEQNKTFLTQPVKPTT